MDETVQKNVLPLGIFGWFVMVLIYKIVEITTWRQAKVEGRFKGAAIDLQDGYIHLSAADQVEETARRYFATMENLLLVAFNSAEFDDTLKWESSRGGALFPHVYGTLNPASAEIAPWPVHPSCPSGFP